MKNLIILGIITFILTACGSQQNSSESAETESLEVEIQTLDSITLEAEAVNQEITKKAEKLDSLINNLDN